MISYVCYNFFLFCCLIFIKCRLVLGVFSAGFANSRFVFVIICVTYSVSLDFFRQSTAGVVTLFCVSVFITRRRSFAEYWKYFVARFNDVHMFSYNSAESERIWMKFGELRVYCLELALTDFGRNPLRSESGRPCGRFVFFVR